MFGKLIKGLRNGQLWYQAHSFLEEKDFANALAVLDRMYRTKTFKVEIDLMKAQTQLELKNYDECFSICCKVLLYLQHLEGLGFADKQYVRVFARVLIEKARSYLSVFDADRHPALSQAEVDAIDLIEVDKDLKRNFPLRMHSKWLETA